MQKRLNLAQRFWLWNLNHFGFIGFFTMLILTCAFFLGLWFIVVSTPLEFGGKANRTWLFLSMIPWLYLASNLFIQDGRFFHWLVPKWAQKSPRLVRQDQRLIILCAPGEPAQYIKGDTYYGPGKIICLQFGGFGAGYVQTRAINITLYNGNWQLMFPVMFVYAPNFELIRNADALMQKVGPRIKMFEKDVYDLDQMIVDTMSDEIELRMRDSFAKFPANSYTSQKNVLRYIKTEFDKLANEQLGVSDLFPIVRVSVSRGLEAFVLSTRIPDQKQFEIIWDI